LVFQSPSGNKAASACFSRVSGTATDGIYSGTVTIPAFTEPGTWVAYAYIYDQVGNYHPYSTSDLQTAGFPTTLSVVSVEDTQAPVLASLDYTPKQVDTSTASADVTVSARITDDLSGFRTGCLVFQSPSGNKAASACFSRVSGTATDGIYSGTVTIPAFTEPGTWVAYAYIYDQVGNYHPYSTSDLQTAGFPTTLKNGPSPIANLSPGTLAFGDQIVGVATANQSITVASIGVATLSISNVSLSGANPGDFSFTASYPTAVPSGTNTTIDVRFAPTTTGARSATLTITDDEASGPQQLVTLTGTGKKATSTSISSSANPSVFAQSVTFVATVSGTAGTPTGTVSFSDGGIEFGSGSMDGTGKASFSTSNLTVGSHTIRAGYQGDSTFTVSTSAALTQTVNPAANTITFGALSDEPLGIAPFTVSATASSGLVVSFASTTPSVCTVSGATVTLVAVGTCTIQATQAGNANYAAATPVNQSFQVTQVIQSQSISFGALSNNVLGAAPFTTSATATSGLAVSFASTTSSVCTVSGASVTLLALGTCTIQATQAGNATYSAATPVNQSFQVTSPGLGTNALLVGNAAGSSSVVLTYSGAWTAAANDSFLHISAGSTSGTSSGVVVFTYDTFTGTGTRTGTLTIAGFSVTVTQAGTNYIGPGAATTLVSSGLNIPTGLAVDSSGNVYIANNNGFTVQKWSASTQQVTTLVSSGLQFPSGVAVDSSGNVYIADANNHAIKEWSASTQQVTALVSSGLNYPSGVAVDGSGNIYIADSGHHAIKEWVAATQQLITLVSSGINYPSAVAVDGSGNVYIADANDNAIKEWVASTQQLTTLVSSGIINPSGVAVDGSGNVYIADTNNGAIKEWSASTQQVTTLVSSGLSGPSGVAVDGAGNVYLPSTYNPQAIKEMPNAFVGPASFSEPTSAGSDSLLQVLPATTSLTGIFAPTSDQSWLTIGNIANGVINFSFTANTSTSARTAHITVLGQQITVTQNGLTAQTITFGTLSNQPLGTAPFTLSATASSGLAVSFASTTSAVCTVSGATVTLVAVGTCTIQATQAGNTTYAAATPVNQNFQATLVIQSQTITFGALSNQVLGAAPFTVSATATSGLPVSFASITSTVCTVSGATVTLVAVGTCDIAARQAGDATYAPTSFDQIFLVTAPELGTNALLVGHAGGSSSVVLTYGSAWTATANDSFLHISGGSTSGTGSAVVVFTYDQLLGTGIRTGTLTIAGFTVTVSQAGTNYIGPGPVTTLVSSGLNTPEGVAVDGSGNVYIADFNNNAIKVWSASTQQVTTLVSSGLNKPWAVAVDGSGNVFIADTYNNAIKEWNASTHQVTTLVSSGLAIPTGVAVDGFGNVYIADFSNNAIKEWNALTQQVTTLVSSGLNEPFGIAVDGSGNLYIVDQSNNAIKEWSALTEQVTTLVSSGLHGPYEVAVDGSGNVYFSDTGNGALKKWSASTQQVTTLVSSGLDPIGVAVDGSGNVYVSDRSNNAIKEIPNAFVGPASLTEPASAGSDSLLQVLPATTSLTGIFAPASDQIWLTIGTIANGVINFSFTANTSTSARTAHITVLGQQITVTQNGLTTQTIAFGTLANQPFGSAPFTVSATAMSGLPVSFASTTSVVCTVSGATVTLVSVGQCTIQATQVGDATYAPATPVNRSFTVTQGSQTITFGGLSSQVLGAASFTISATATSGLSVSFASITSAMCTVSSATVTLVAVGTCTIQATQGGNANYAAATPVNQSFRVIALQSIAVAPGNPSLANGLTLQFTATGTYTDASTRDITNSVTWTSLKPAVATIATAGLATAVGQGTATIRAASGGISGSTILTVIAPALVSISITPVNPAILTARTQQFAASGMYTDSSVKTITTSVTWSSTNASVATISSGGLATGIGVGTSNIRAALGGISGTTTLTVQPALVSIAITPVNPSIKVGTTLQFTATGTYSDSSTQNLTNSVTWTSSKPAIATINTSGLATAIATGSTNMKAKLGGITSPTTALAVSP
jgi:DNA-binding beta-propeller fold protein YncE